MKKSTSGDKEVIKKIKATGNQWLLVGVATRRQFN